MPAYDLRMKRGAKNKPKRNEYWVRCRTCGEGKPRENFKTTRYGRTIYGKNCKDCRSKDE